MKKLLSTIIAVAMLSSLTTVAFASTIETNGGSCSKDVLAKISDESTKDTVYYVDITWGEMKFTYKKSGSMEWNADDHTYTEKTTSEWTAIGNDITVTNHSNAPIDVELNFEKDPSITDEIIGSLDITTMNLPSAEGKTVDDDKLTGTASLTLSGEANTIGTEFVKIGTITVSLI